MTLPTTTTLLIPDPDAIRTAIDAADERARLLRRLLRVAMRLQASSGETGTPSEVSVGRPVRQAERPD